MSWPTSPDFSALLRAALPTGVRQRICVAYSGGLDSTVLLHLLAALQEQGALELSALHVHHGLSPRADDWALHCERVCLSLGVSLRVASVRVPRDEGKGLEAAARAVRHAEFLREPADWIALAHHADDQAETLLHRLVRGSGVAGASAMRALDPARRLWRPMLGWARQDLRDWAEAHSLCWIEDESNADERFFRNFLRHEILAPLSARFPAAGANLARAAAQFAESADLLDEVGVQDWALVGEATAGSRARFAALSEARQHNTLRSALRQMGELAPDRARTIRLCAALAGEGVVREPLGRWMCCAWRNRLWFESATRTLPDRQVWRGESELRWGSGRLSIVPELVDEAASVPEQLFEFRPRAGGERLSLGEGRPRRGLRQLCQEAGVPAWWRDELPLLWREGELVWAGGVGMGSPLPGRSIRWTGPDGLTRG